MPHRGFHWHEGVAHDHEHELVGHHGPPFGKRKVIEVEEPSLVLLLKRSIEQAEAKRRDDEWINHDD